MTLAELLAARPVVLLDFDGPVCAVFGGERSAPEVARQLAQDMRARGIQLPPDVEVSGDPFDVLRAAAAHDPTQAAVVESALRDAEVRAVSTAPMTPGLPDALVALRDSGHTITAVSNNSDAAVQTFLTAHGLQTWVAHVTARTEADPALLKPNPHLVLRAIALNHSHPSTCVLIGDSTTDITAAHEANCAVIAYANKPGKRATFAAYHPDAVIYQVSDLTVAATRPYVC